MKLNETIELFKGGSSLARQLKVTRQAVTNWKAKGDLIPELYARRLDGTRVGKRVLRFDPKAYGLDS
jgi:hypothetical protein